MKSIALVGLMLLGAAAVDGAADPTLLAIEDANCVPQSWAVPVGLDPNVIEGRLLPLDPNGWAVPAGKFNRVGLCCDPEGDPLDVTVTAGTTRATVTCDPDAGTWRLSVEVVPGLNLWTVQATDRPVYGEPKTSVWTVVANGVAPPNTMPVLH